MNAPAVSDYLVDLQNRVAAELERIDGKRFKHDRWQRPTAAAGKPASSRTAICSSAAA